MNRNTVTIYDTTLRDGAQGEGVSFSLSGKIKLAKQLDDFGIDYIEGGFPGSNKKDMSFFNEMRNVKLSHAKLVAFGSTRRRNTKLEDDISIRGLLSAGTQYVAVFGKTWMLHVRDVLRVKPSENFKMIFDTVSYLKKKGKKVFFDAEHFFDGYNDDADFAIKAIECAADAGADCIVLCDTNGGCLPNEIYSIVSAVGTKLSVPIGIHTHNDAGMAVANTLEAVRAGATQVQVTVNGLGERCGNADLCSVLPALSLKMNIETFSGKSLKKLSELSNFVDELLDMRHNSRAPYVGMSAFAHKGGPHVNAVQKNPRTFEHIDPSAVGNKRRILISELSGGTSILMKAIELGIGKKKSAREARKILATLKELEGRGYVFEAADASFKLLIQKVLKEHKSFFELEGFRVIVEKRSKDEPCLSEATIKVRVKKELEQTVAEGNGPVNALDTALRKALAKFYPVIAKVVLADFHVAILDPESATGATTRVLIESSDGQQTWGTVGVSQNIIEASWQALVDSVEYKLFKEEEKKYKAGTVRKSNR